MIETAVIRAEQEADLTAVDHVHRPSSPETMPAPPRIFAGSWLDRERGISHGAWVDASQDDAAITADVAAMLQRSPTAARNGVRATNWGIFDAEDFPGLDLGAENSLAWVGAVGRGIARYGSTFGAYASIFGNFAALADYENNYLGSWPSLDAYAASFAVDPGYNRLLDDNLPDSVRGYVRLDTAAIARDMTRAQAVHLAPLPDGQVAIFAAQ